MAMNGDDLMKYFKTWEYSLFNIPLEAIPTLRTHSSVDDVTVNWPGDANFAAVSRLVKEHDMGTVMKFVDAAMAVDSTSIHAWCNKGVYHLMQPEPEIELAQEAKSKMDEYMDDDAAETEAKVEFGYWMYEGVRTRRSRKDGLEILKMTVSGRNVGNVVHHFVFMKVLARKATNADDYDLAKDWLHGVLRNLVGQMMLLVASKVPQYELEVWTYLADVRQCWFCEKMLTEIMVTDLQRLAIATRTPKERTLDIEFCIMRMLEIKRMDRVKVNSNFYARVGKFYLNLATKQKDKKHRISLLESALEFGEKYQGAAASKNELGPEWCARILIHLWAIRFYYVNRIQVKKEYSTLMMSDVPHDKFVWPWLAEEYYSKQPDENNETRELLEKARGHLKTHYATGGRFIELYPRVKLLLGDPVDEVEAEFTKHLDVVSGNAKIIFCQHYGSFLECVGRKDEAIGQYLLAVEISKGLRDDDTASRPFIALHGLQRNNVSPPREIV